MMKRNVLPLLTWRCCSLLLAIGLLTPVMSAAVAQQEVAVAPTIQQQLFHAVVQDKVSTVRDLLQKGGDPNARTTPAKEDAWMLEGMSQGDSAPPIFLTACRFMSIEGPKIIQLLLEKGAQVNLADRNGITPLMAAAPLGGSVSLLIERGADVNAKDRQGKTPLMYAMQNRGLSTVSLLLARGAAMNAKDTSGRTPLMYAITQASQDPVRLYGEDLNRKAQKEKTAYIELIRYLIQQKADVNIKDKNGDTALTIAKRQGNPEIVKLLTQAGAK